MNMQITPPQKKAIESGEVVEIVVDQIECVVIRKDVYDREKQRMYDDSAWTEGEINALASQSADAADDSSPIK
jgi:hypothetical protein